MNKEQDWERKNEAYDLRLRGKTYRDIADACSISAATAYRWVQEVLDATVLPNVEAVRKQEIDRLMRYLDKLDTRIEDGDDKAISLAIKVSERLSKMLGVDAPQQISVEKTEVTQMDLAIQELIASQHARNELRKQEAVNNRSDAVADVADTLSSDVESIVLEN